MEEFYYDTISNYTDDTKQKSYMVAIDTRNGTVDQQCPECGYFHGLDESCIYDVKTPY